MPTDVIMPQMGESIFEGTITKWLKKPGDPVEKDEPLFEISTDKVDAEIPSPIAGVLSEIKFPEGATVQVNAVVAVLSENGSFVAAAGGQEKSALTQTATTQVTKVQLTPPQGAQLAGETEIVMPQMGESIFEGTITKWLKKVGDQVQKDEPLFEISTDKVDAEIPSPVDGVLTEIKTAEGATVEVNTVVAVIGGSTSAAVDRASGSEKPPRQSQGSAATSSVSGAPKAQLAPLQVVQRSSPLVRRIAKENNIDLTLVSGTGSNGRVTKDDILQHLSQPNAPQLAPKAQLTPPQGTQPKAAPSQPAALKDEIVPLTKMRAIIAQRMLESKRTIPHAHSVYKVDMTRIVRLRERERAGFEQRHGVKLTYMPFIAAAAVGALRKFPILNASLLENAIQYHGNINLGIAVALEWGLIVPVIRASERSRFRQPGALDQRSGGPRAFEEAVARRSRRLDLHSHQSWCFRW